ncbi:hypothetical protein MPDQ_007849 [Monascus purpureus]|uniref:Uncharacterized protein n=1 Tax=Monascus purpureus TaxID=5098 RepID=A0A507R498_MONPU|nr:hypothetical protein MPDQ_007849 [Monascus purpureus]
MATDLIHKPADVAVVWFIEYDAIAGEDPTSRAVLFTKAGGQLALRNLDLAAHRSLFSSHVYRNIEIPVHADSLAARLSNALAPFFSNPEKHTNLQRHNSWALEDDEWSGVQEGFVDVFNLALTLKSDLLVGTHKYAVLHFPPRSTFMEVRMQAESRAGDRTVDVPGMLRYSSASSLQWLFTERRV